MTTWLFKTLNDGLQQSRTSPRYPVSLLFFTIGLIFLGQVDHELISVIIETCSDAYLAVSVFVALTLSGFYFFDKLFKSELTELLNRQSPVQIPLAAFLGALPGCGGAIIVVTQFVHGKMSFGALVAVLISTMGDAAFLLIATKPDIALLVYGLSMAGGIITGYLINLIHGSDYLKPLDKRDIPEHQAMPKLPQNLSYLFWVLLLPGSLLGILNAFLVDTDAFFGPLASYEPTKWIGFSGALVCLAIWLSQPLSSWSARFAKKPELNRIRETVVAETSFISIWVIFGFLCYELLVAFTGLDLASSFRYLGALAPLLAVAIGFIPGCGPQILVTTLYINGVVPLSSQIANAISNDGDALFPAIALAPRAALKATLYSAVPAIILGYGAWFAGF
ncbi:putative manganese transporter [Thalassolituus sp.]|uniref:putative manganese transporter n=1 Tax=Thalassolituus sp. TaxID=2030822 RepID=UPI00351128DC